MTSNHKIQKQQGRLDKKKISPRYILVHLLNTKEKDNFLKQLDILFKKSKRFTVDFSTETMDIRGN